MERVSISAYLEDFVRHGSQCAYVQRRGYRTERWAYGEVAETIYKFARELEGRGVSRGDRVLIWGENCAEWVIAFFACVLRGAIAVPMDNTATAEFTNRVAIYYPGLTAANAANPLPGRALAPGAIVAVNRQGAPFLS